MVVEENKKKKEEEKKVEIKFFLPEKVYEDFYAEFKIISTLSPTRIGKFEKFDDLLIFYLNKLVCSCDDFFKLENYLFNIITYLRKIGVPVEDFDDLIKKLDTLKKNPKKGDQGKS